jgi:hypothetical protein
MDNEVSYSFIIPLLTLIVPLLYPYYTFIVPLLCPYYTLIVFLLYPNVLTGVGDTPTGDKISYYPLIISLLHSKLCLYYTLIILLLHFYCTIITPLLYPYVLKGLAATPMGGKL